jgi:hypothetical protein
VEYSINYNKKSRVCEIRVIGPHKRPSDSQKLLRIAGNFAKEKKCSRFLFDAREAVIEGGIVDAYYTVINHEQYGIGKHFRIAAVYSTITEYDKFMQTVGFNRGAMSFQVFDNFDAAHAWIYYK